MNQYKLSKYQLSAAIAVPGLVISSIIFLMLLTICVLIGPRVTKFAMFKAVFVALCLIPFILLIAAIGAAASVLPSIVGCYSGKGAGPLLTGFTFQNGGFTPSAQFTSQYNPLTGSPGATVTSAIVVPGAGSANLIAAVVVLFLVMVVGAIKTDFEGGNEL